MADRQQKWRIGNVHPNVWAEIPTQGKWIYAQLREDPELTIRFCFVDSATGPTCVAVMFDRDGHEVTARDLRRAPIGEILEFGRGSLGEFAHIPKPKVLPRPARPGAKGLPAEHWQTVWELYEQALRAAPRRPIQWMRTQWKPEVADATMRRWVQRAREIFEGEQ